MVQKAELGPYAYEKRMPSQLRRLLETRDLNHISQAPKIIPMLTTLCAADATLEKAYLCHPSVRYITTIRGFLGATGEGNWACGYRNLQMLLGYLLATEKPIVTNGARVNVDKDGTHKQEIFERKREMCDEVPTVLQLQEMIEQAWDTGLNAHGRIQMGGVQGTRKFIGTSEVVQSCISGSNNDDDMSKAQAVLGLHHIHCTGHTFPNPYDKSAVSAFDQVLGFVEAYFVSSAFPSADSGESIARWPPHVMTTNKPPLFLQRRRHSVTIVGFEVRKEGEKNLLVLDPAYPPFRAMNRTDMQRIEGKSQTKLLKAYRRGKDQMRKYDTFEVLTLEQG